MVQRLTVIIHFPCSLWMTRPQSANTPRGVDSIDCGPTPGVSCAAGRCVEGGGRRQEAAARQCACGRRLERHGFRSPGTAGGWGTPRCNRP